MKYLRSIFAVAAAAAVLLPATALAQTRLTTALEIRSLSVAEAERGIPVEIRGIVVFIEGPAAIFVQDETSTTFFRVQQMPVLEVGDEIELRGKTRMGLYLPGIDYAQVNVIGRGRALPPAIPVRFDDLVFGRYHYQRVAIEGIVRSVRPEGSRTLIRVAMGSRVMEARVEEPPKADLSLVDHRVRVTGLASGFINERRQLVQPYVRLRNWSEVEVLAPARPVASIPMISAEELLAFRVSGHGEQRVGIDGTVTAVFPPDQVFLRQASTGFAVRLATPAPLAPGDYAAIAGFPEMDRFSASVVDAELIRREPGPPPSPVPLESPDQLAGPLDGSLVSVSGSVRDVFWVDGGTMLMLAGEARTIQTRLPDGVVLPAVGAQVRVTGICRVESAAQGSALTSRAGTVSLRARSPADLVILKQGPWWTPRRLLVLLGVLLGVTLLAFLWIAILRRQVQRQTEVLRARIESEAALEERHRIAREFHDTLEQELAGVSLRLDALATRELDDKGRNLIAASRNLVSRIQSETRDLICDLRDPTENAGDLATALAGVAARHSAESGVDVRSEMPEALPRLPPATVHDLRMIAREATTNAVKHGGATRVRIRAQETPGELVLEVIDNGSGFDASLAADRRGHFGCAGIRERAHKIGAQVTWRSAPARGTVVEVVLPLGPSAGDPAASRSAPATAGEPKPLAS